MNEPNEINELRPLSIGRVIDKTFKITIANFKNYLKIVSLYYGILLTIAVILITIIAFIYYLPQFKSAFPIFDSKNETAILIFLSPFMIIFGIITLLFTVFYTAMTTDLFSKAFLGMSWSFRQSLSLAFKKFWSILGSLILSGFIFIAGICSLILGVYPAMVLICLIPPALINENLTATQSVKRSFELVKYNFGHLFGYLMLFYCLSLAFSYIYQIVLAIFSSILGVLPNISGSNSTLSSLFIVVISIVILIGTLLYLCVAGAVSSTYFVILYFNQKVKFENYGVELLIEEFF